MICFLGWGSTHTGVFLVYFRKRHDRHTVEGTNTRYGTLTCALPGRTNEKVLQEDMGCMPATLALGRRRQENQKFKACVDYVRIPFPKNNQKRSEDKTASSFFPPLARRHLLPSSLSVWSLCLPWCRFPNHVYVTTYSFQCVVSQNFLK